MGIEEQRGARLLRPAIASLLAGTLLMSGSTHSLAGEVAPDPPRADDAAHSEREVVSQTLDEQLAALRVKVRQLDAAIQRPGVSRTANRVSAPSGATPMAEPMEAAPAGMSASASADGKQMKSGGTPKMCCPGMGASMAKSVKGGSGDPAMPGGAQEPPTSSGGMGLKEMAMAGMMGESEMRDATALEMPQSTLPGFPGASHLYHIGSTGFFLDHPEHIALSAEQSAALNRAKQRAVLLNSKSEIAISHAEHELWTLTASDQPDAAKIQIKVREISTLNADARLAFIRAVGDASKVLTDEQRKRLTGSAAPPPPAVKAASPASVPKSSMREPMPKAGAVAPVAPMADM